jgi:hypothetical protein
MSTQRPSSIPPSRAKWQWALLGLLVAVTGLVAAITQRIVLAPAPTAQRGIERPSASGEDKPIPVPRKEQATTNDGVIEARIIRDHANTELIAHRDRIAMLELRACILERAVREHAITLAALEAGKRASEVRAAVRSATKHWDDCGTDMKALHERGSLRDAADSALRR